MNGGSYWGNLGSETYFVKQQCNLNNLGTDLKALSFLCMFLNNALTCHLLIYESEGNRCFTPVLTLAFRDSVHFSYTQVFINLQG